MRVKETALAKINLYLDVIGKREDGFHNIETVMQSISLTDELEIEYNDDGIGRVSLEIIGNDSLLADDNNLVIRAVNAYKEKHAFTGSLSITLTKKIPISAGLAGGSADAAATLRALNKIFGSPLSKAELNDLGASLGSDIPFCLVGGTALCYGRGEKMVALDVDMPLHLVLVKTDESVSTPKAYKILDQIYDDFKLPRVDDGRKDVLENLKNGRYDKLYNIFETPVLAECKKAHQAIKRLSALGAGVTLMSGSGPSVFGIFKDEISAKSAVDILSQEAPFVCYAKNNT